MYKLALNGSSSPRMLDKLEGASWSAASACFSEESGLSELTCLFFLARTSKGSMYDKLPKGLKSCFNLECFKRLLLNFP